jgi:two-component system, chemotaxis family, sensor kinase CheA
MDTSEYMPMFLAEAREHLQELNLAVVRLEENPEDRPTVDQIFRIAHSLKGMSATMGFAQIAKLTHEMEDVFELLRQRGAGLRREAVDTVLGCLDALSEAIESIESGGEEQLDPGALIGRLRSLVRARTPKQQIDRAGGAAIPEPELIAAARADGHRVLHITATLDEDVIMPAVRAHMILAALAERGELLGSAPTPDGVELFEGRQVTAWIASDLPEADVSAVVLRISDIAGVEVAETRDAPADEDGLSDDETDGLAEIGAAPGAVPAGAAATDGAHAARTVRVDAERLDALMHLMGELVIHRTAVEALTANLESTDLQQAVQKLTRSSQELQSMVMQVRMIPVDVVFLRFPRLVRDVSGKLGKGVELELIGRDTELDRTVVDALGDPLVHLVRNALDHGLESPDEREAAGKPRTGKVQIAARHAGGSVVIEVRDDGRGIDPRKVAAKARSIGLIDAEAADQLDLRGAVELLFAAGFSTAEATSDISGRGVGMDAVRAKIRELGGEVVLDSKPGQGTLAQIRLPLTLAIVFALQVDIAGVPFAIPLDRVERTLRLAQHSVRAVAGRRVLVLEDGVIPLIEGARAFGREPNGAHELAVIVRGQDRRLGLAVDQLIGQRELVTRPLPSVVSDGQPVSGGAVLADGKIALIVDCDALATALLDDGVAASPITQLAA